LSIFKKAHYKALNVLNIIIQSVLLLL